MMPIVPVEPEPDKAQAILRETEVNAQIAAANENRQQAIRMMELLPIALQGVDWCEIEEGRADDPERNALITNLSCASELAFIQVADKYFSGAIRRK